MEVMSLPRGVLRWEYHDLAIPLNDEALEEGEVSQ